MAETTGSGTTTQTIALQPTAGKFDFHEAPPFAVAYLSTYYNQPPTADETAVSLFLMEQFKKKKPTGRFLELGCGPTIHHIFPFAPHVSEIHMADYLEDNLEQVRLWRGAAPRAHDWAPYAGMTLRHEGVKDTPEAVANREELARKKITRVMHCDLKNEIPQEFVGRYDCVGCFYCAEEIGISIPEWREVVRRVGDYLRPGGMLYMAALAGMNKYDVKDATGTVVEYPCACITEEEIRSGLPLVGFKGETLAIKSSEIAHPDCGVTGALMVAAEKR